MSYQQYKRMSVSTLPSLENISKREAAEKDQPSATLAMVYDDDDNGNDDDDDDDDDSEDELTALTPEEKQLDALIHVPLQCGFLLAFCESQFNAENVKFIMTVDDFKAHLNIDKTSWRTNDWRQIDDIVEAKILTKAEIEGTSNLFHSNLFTPQNKRISKII